MIIEPPRASTPPGLRSVVDEGLFRFLLDLEIAKAARLQYCVSVICLTPDLPDGQTDPTAARRVAEVATRACRAVDAVTAVSPATICFLLIDAETDDLPRIVSRTTAELEGRLLAREPGEQHVTWSAGAGCYPFTATSGPELLRQATDLSSRARREGGDRLSLPV